MFYLVEKSRFRILIPLELFLSLSHTQILNSFFISFHDVRKRIFYRSSSFILIFFPFLGIAGHVEIVFVYNFKDACIQPQKKEISGFLFAFFFGPLHNACIYNFYFESQWARMEKRETTQGKEEMEKLCVQKRIWDEMKTEKLRKR